METTAYRIKIIYHTLILFINMNLFRTAKVN